MYIFLASSTSKVEKRAINTHTYNGAGLMKIIQFENKFMAALQLNPSKHSLPQLQGP